VLHSTRDWQTSFEGSFSILETQDAVFRSASKNHLFRSLLLNQKSLGYKSNKQISHFTFGDIELDLIQPCSTLQQQGAGTA
jgi:hypothetical protein